MIGVEFIPGYGLGNQLFFYISARCIAKDLGFSFGAVNPQQLGNVPQSQKGMYFMDLDLGTEIPREEMSRYERFDEQDDRLYVGYSAHDMEHGCYISGADQRIYSIHDNTLIYGNLQAEEYFGSHKDDICKWLKVKPEYESWKYTDDNLCIINMRGGEYTGHPELYLDRRYWLHAIANMKKINPGMHFLIVTEDEEAARKVLPEYECHHFGVAEDYVTIKNAKYLILSNSSFSLMPVITSTTLRYAIAPKYWARHNVSDGFWSSEQNIYSFLHYQDKNGKIWEPEECKKELEEYKKTSSLYRRRNVRPNSIRKTGQKIESKCRYGVFYGKKIWRSVERRTGIIKAWQSDLH